MIKMLFLVPLSFLAFGCATTPRCAITGNSQTIFRDSKACEVRIRQVVVASKMSLPSSVKVADLSTWEMGWVDSELRNGVLYGGHFTLMPPEVSEKK